MKTVIFHVDVNSAFLSWEAVYRLRHLGGTKDLREGICAVGGDSSARHGIILAKSIKAKQFGVRTGESILEAKRKCPVLELVPANYELYNRSSRALMELLREYSPNVEPYSIDEAFMDMTGMEALLGPPVEAAERIRDRICTELGFTVNIGVSTNRLLAKMASDFQKPNLVHTLFPEEIEGKMWPLPVRELFFVGSSTRQKLSEMGIHTIGDLARTDPALLTGHLKKHGEVIWNFANGRADSVVEAEAPDNKGYGNSTTIAFDVTDTDTARMVLLSLAETVAGRLRNHHVKAEQISVSIKSWQLQTRSHQTVLDSPTNITSEIHRAACLLFEELWDGTPIRLLGIQTGRLREDGSRQMNIFDRTDYEKLEKLDKAVDEIRSRFGNDAVMRASFAQRRGSAGGADRTDSQEKAAGSGPAGNQAEAARQAQAEGSGPAGNQAEAARQAQAGGSGPAGKQDEAACQAQAGGSGPMGNQAEAARQAQAGGSGPAGSRGKADKSRRARTAGPEEGGLLRIDHMSGGISREKRTVDYSRIKIE